MSRGTDTTTTPPTLGADLAATTALCCFSIAVGVGYCRVFSGWQFLADVVVIAVVGHAIGFALRRLRVSGLLAVPALALVLAWLIGLLFAGETYSWGLPTGDTWPLVSSQLEVVREQFSVAVAPVIYGGGWDVLAAIGLALAVLLGDVFAFRAMARAEALVPGGVLFVFVGALGDDRLRIASTVLLVAVGVVTTAALRHVHDSGTRRVRHRDSALRLVPLVTGVAVVVAVVAGTVGPRLPGADAEPLYETRGGGGSATTVVSPLVDIRSRLTNQSEVVLFVVDADGESYWRSSALPEFDGTTWGLPEQPLATASSSAPEPAAGSVELRQTITVTNLGGRLVPAAADPVNASGRRDLRWDPETSTIVTVDGDLERGDVIDIRSASPRFTPQTLAAATSDDPGDPIYTELPTDLPDVVASSALQATAGARNNYEAALLMQMWFRRQFTYSLEVQPGHSGSAIESFLRERVGYCEQFAGTYAAMMRTLDIPARVAVGFTPGVERPDGRRSVQGKHAHAWPEVWFDDVGWVPFEPTPNRGAPGNEQYTNLDAQQESDIDEAATNDDAVPATTVPFGPNDDQLDLQVPTEFADPTGAGGSDATEADDDGSVSWWPILALAGIGLLLASPAIVRDVRARRRRRNPEQEMAALWTRSVASLVDAGVPVQRSDTPMETARAAATHLPIVARPVSSLASVVTEATYSPAGTEGFAESSIYGGSVLSNCANWSRQIDRAVDDEVSLPTRLRRYFTDLG